MTKATANKRLARQREALAKIMMAMNSGVSFTKACRLAHVSRSTVHIWASDNPGDYGLFERMKRKVRAIDAVQEGIRKRQ